MEKHREVLADRPKAGRQELLGRAADHDPVALRDGQAEQCIADRSADLVDFHDFHHTRSVFDA
jgi:hypothetical protein